MPRRGMNIYKRKDGRWEGRIKKEGDAQGRRPYRSVYGRTYSEVKARMEAVKTKPQKDDKKEQGTVGEAVQIWLRERAPYWKKTTYAVYSHMACKHIIPRLESVPLESVDGERMEAFLSELRQEKELSIRYQRSICALVLRVMKYMKKRHHLKAEILENPLTPEKQKEKQIPEGKKLAVLEQYLTEHAGKGDGTSLGILTAFYTGLRIGEVCALTWGDIDLEDGLIHVRHNLQRVKAADGQKNNTVILRQSPKTETSCRRIPIPPVLLPLLEKNRQEAGQYLIKGKKKPWAEPRTLQYRFAGILKACGLEPFNFHMLRHAFATYCIAEGFDVKSLSEILGHSSIQITLNLYVHSNMKRKRQLMGQFGDYLYADSCADSYADDYADRCGRGV